MIRTLYLSRDACPLGIRPMVSSGCFRPFACPFG